MRIPAKVKYAFKAVLELAQQADSGHPVQLSLIAKRQQIPEQFLAQLFVRLKTAGIVTSSRGVSGGYFLARQPSRIMLADVVKAVDAQILGTDDARSTGASRGQLIGDTLLRSIWKEMNDEMLKKMQVSFEELKERSLDQGLVYHI